jgi:hypothetical protein
MSTTQFLNFACLRVDLILTSIQCLQKYLSLLSLSLVWEKFLGFQIIDFGRVVCP